MLPICEAEGGPTSHAHIGVDPFGWLGTDLVRFFHAVSKLMAYRTAVKHTARNLCIRRKLEPFSH